MRALTPSFTLVESLSNLVTPVDLKAVAGYIEVHFTSSFSSKRTVQQVLWALQHNSQTRHAVLKNNVELFQTIFASLSGADEVLDKRLRRPVAVLLIYAYAFSSGGNLYSAQACNTVAVECGLIGPGSAAAASAFFFLLSVQKTNTSLSTEWLRVFAGVAALMVVDISHSLKSMDESATIDKDHLFSVIHAKRVLVAANEVYKF